MTPYDSNTAVAGRLANTTENRRMQRREMPGSERLLWQRLRGHRLDGYKFRRKHGVGPYIVDFFCCEAQLAIEVCSVGSGQDSWADSARQRARERFLRSLGIEVLRFTDREIYTDLEGMVMRVAEELQRRIRERRDSPGDAQLESTEVQLEKRIQSGTVARLDSLPWTK